MSSAEPRTVSLDPESVKKEAANQAIALERGVARALEEARARGKAATPGLLGDPEGYYIPTGSPTGMDGCVRAVVSQLGFALEAAFMRGLVEGSGT